MPKRTPSYRQRTGYDRAIVTLSDRVTKKRCDYWLGGYESPASRDSAPERAIRSQLHRRGLVYRVDCRPEQTIPRWADIVFTKLKIAVFIDGCF